MDLKDPLGGAVGKGRRRTRRILLLVTAVLLQSASIRPGPPREDPDGASLAALVFAVLAGLSLLRIGTAPSAVLGVASAAYVGQVALIGPVVPVVMPIAAYAVARRGTDQSALPARGHVAALCGALAAVVAAVVVEGDAALAAPYAVLVLAAVLAGLLVGARAVAADTRRRDAVAAERVRIARDLHDVVGHGIAAITVQAGAGRLAIDAGAPQDASRALAAIEEAGRDVLRDVRWLVGLIREGAEHPSLTDLPALVEAARHAGVDVELDLDDGLSDVDASAGEAGYRIVQESLTNAMRHVHEPRVRVRARRDGSLVRVEVVDDGTAAVDAMPGNGLIGIRERAAAVGGTATWGPLPNGAGWAVTAELPTAGAAQ